MDKVYNHKIVEEKLYKQWEEKGYFKPEINPKGKPYSIILPPPNANAPLHFGHAMYVIEDILIRFHRMRGFKTLWLAGADHAGFETQFVFEKKLAEQGKSRFDFDREALYKMIWDYVSENKKGMEGQLARLGFSLDFSREKFTLDPDIVAIVYKTFKKLYDEGLVFRAERLVNYCTYDGTSFSDLEVVTEEVTTTLYEILYPLKEGGGIVVATGRPETLFGDVAVMVNPKDPRYKKLIGKKVKLPLTDKEIPVIADDTVDMKFGTGAVKVTPFHDFNDWEVGQRHKLEGIQVIGFDGKMKNTGVVDGLYAKPARTKTLELLAEKGLLRGEKEYPSTKRTCYKCKNILEPLPMEQWFIKMQPLAKAAIEAVKKGDIKIYPKSFEKIYFQFLENIRDWNISRQIVWGIRIPAFKCRNVKCQMSNVKSGTWIVTEGERPEKCPECGSEDLEQDSDTFDTWFSSAQWPFATLQTLGEDDFKTFYPTSVMETGYDILRWWVARMVMIGVFATEKVPFENVVLHGLVNDPLGKKMSKSKNNVVNPMELVDTYGADAVRFALVYGTALGNDQALSYPKLSAMRKFTNKLWNIGRFIELYTKDKEIKFVGELMPKIHMDSDKAMRWCSGQIEETTKLIKEISNYIEKYQFNYAAERLYEYSWHEFADINLEVAKTWLNQDIPEAPYIRGTLLDVYQRILILLHPFMPFITEELYQKFDFKHKEESVMIEEWPYEKD